MSKRQEEAKILIGCGCGHQFSQWDLYFCSSCEEIRCRFCIREEIDSNYCPACLENVTSSTATKFKNRCPKCFECPRCSAQLIHRKSLSSPAEYYLSCVMCRWSSLHCLSGKTVEVTPLPPSVGVVGGVGGTGSGVDALLGGSSSSPSVSPLSPSPSPLSPTPLSPTPLSPTPSPSSLLDLGEGGAPPPSLPCTTLAPVSHADSPDDLALRNILYEKDKDQAQEAVTKVIKELQSENELGFDLPISFGGLGLGGVLTPMASPDVGVGSASSPSSSGSSGTINLSEGLSSSSSPLKGKDSSAAIRQIETSREAAASSLTFSSKSVTRRGGGADEVEGVKNVQGSFLEDVNGPNLPSPLPSKYSEKRQTLLSLCSETVTLSVGICHIGDVPLTRKKLLSRRSKRCGKCDKHLVKPSLNSTEFQRQHSACHFIPTFSVFQWEKTKDGDSMTLQLRAANLSDEAVKFHLKPRKNTTTFRGMDVVSSQITSLSDKEYEIKGKVTTTPSNVLIPIVFTSPVDWNSHHLLSLSLFLTTPKVSLTLPLSLMIRTSPSASLCESLSNSLASPTTQRASAIQSPLPKMQSVFHPDGREVDGEAKAYY